MLVHRTDGTNEVHMRGPGGKLIGAYRIDWENGNGLYTLPVRLEQHERVHVAGRLLFVGGSFVATNRPIRAVGWTLGDGERSWVRSQRGEVG